MAQQHLHTPKIGPVVKEMGCKSVAQRMGGKRRIDPCQGAVPLDELPKRLSCHRLTPPCQKYRTAFLLTEQ